MEKETTRQAVERMIKADRRISAAEVARQLGVSRARVALLLNQMGYELRTEWTKVRKR